jgi:hypothetical protein
MIAKLEHTLQPTATDPQAVVALLEWLPLRDGDLMEAPQAELRGVFESLQLGCVYDPGRHAATISVTLVGDTDNPGVSQDGSAHPACHNANLNPLVEGPTIRLSAVHAKVRREGYGRGRPG